MVMTDEDNALVVASVDVAKAANAGKEVPASVLSLMRAIASTREEQKRHEMAQAASILAGPLGDVALHVLRIGIFALA